MNMKCSRPHFRRYFQDTHTDTRNMKFLLIYAWKLSCIYCIRDTASIFYKFFFDTAILYLKISYKCTKIANLSKQWFYDTDNEINHFWIVLKIVKLIVFKSINNLLRDDFIIQYHQQHNWSNNHVLYKSFLITVNIQKINMNVFIHILKIFFRLVNAYFDTKIPDDIRNKSY